MEVAAEEEAAGGARKPKRPRVGGDEERAGAEVEAVERDLGGGVYEKELLLLQEEEEEDGNGGGITEEAVAEVMLWLEAEISNGSHDAAGFVTINGNEESCGPSFSCAASTVMASVDTRAGAPTPLLVPWPFPPEAKKDAASKEEAAAVDDDYDEAWLADLLLACGPALEGI